MHKIGRVRSLAIAAVIGAGYAALTYISGALGLAYGNVQFRLSELLCVLPVFSPAAIPGLTLGCFIGNLASPFGIYDIIFGTLATFIAALLSRSFKKVCVKGIPVISLLCPVIVNAVLVGLEVSILSNVANTALVTVFAVTFFEVAIGESAVMLLLGLPLIVFIKRTPVLLKLFSDR